MNLRLISVSLLLASTVIAAPGKPVPSGWQTYTDTSGAYQINYPPSWQVLNKGNAVVISSPGGPDERGVFGITPRPSGTSIEESVEKEFSNPDRPTDLQKVPSRIAGKVGMKVWGSKKGDPNIRVVEYYVEDAGQQFYILFQAPHGAMAKFTPIFNSMIGSMQFQK